LSGFWGRHSEHEGFQGVFVLKGRALSLEIGGLAKKEIGMCNREGRMLRARRQPICTFLYLFLLVVMFEIEYA